MVDSEGRGGGGVVLVAISEHAVEFFGVKSYSKKQEANKNMTTL